MYEYLITFDQEIQCVWRRKWTATSVLLLSIRYITILAQMIGWSQLSAVVGYLVSYFLGTY